MANFVSKHTGAQIDAAVEQVGVLDGKVNKYGEGLYELQARFKDGTTADYYDNRNQVWDVYRINAPITVTE